MVNMLLIVFAVLHSINMRGLPIDYKFLTIRVTAPKPPSS